MRPGWAGAPRRGFALLTAMWLVVAIAAVALEFSLHEQQRRMTAIDVAERTQAYAAANAGIATTRSRIIRLLEGVSSGTADQFASAIDSADPWQRADSLFSGSERVGNGRYVVTVRDAGSVLNINLMSEDNWRTLLTATGVDYDTADQLAQTIMDWTDLDDDPRPRGAEREQYLRARRLVLPPNKRFASVGQLRDVMGMTPDIYKRVAPYLSIGTPGLVSVNTADAAVLRTVPGFTDEVVAAVLAERGSNTRFKSLQDLMQQVPVTTQTELTQAADSIGNHTTFKTQALIVQSVGWAPGGYTHVTSEVVFARQQNQTQTVWRKDE
jgi:general secretion pathway protein K